MNENETISLADLHKQVGGEPRYSKWYTIDQSKIDAFADATDDWQFIHSDPERAAKETPFGGTIAHGFLSLSLLSAIDLILILNRLITLTTSRLCGVVVEGHLYGNSLLYSQTSSIMIVLL